MTSTCRALVAFAFGLFEVAHAGFHSAGFDSPTSDRTAPLPTDFTPQVQGAGYGGLVTPDTAAHYGDAPGTKLVALSDSAAKIVGGMAEAFLGGEHGVLTPSELSCLSDGASKLAGGVMDTAGRTVQTFHVIKSQHAGDVMSASVGAAQAGISVNPNAQNPVDPLIAGLELSQRLSSMMEFEEKISSKCLKEDAKAEMKAASTHLSNVTFMGGRFVSNGVDIITELGKAAGAYEDGNYRIFGDNIGLAARKVLLSKRGGGIHELMIKPSDDDIEDVTKGIVKTLFQRGMTVEISTDALTTLAPPPPQYMQSFTLAPGTNATTQAPPTLVPWVLLPATEVNVDLHQCIAGNQQLFRSAWTPVWTMCSKMVKGETVGAGKDMNTLEKATGEGAEGFGALAMSMLDTQIALRRCGFTAEQQAILYDSMQAGNDIHTKFMSGEHEKITKTDMSANMADALEFWKNKNFEKFGMRLGEAFRDLAITVFPEKYYVDKNGQLRKHLVQLADAGRAEDPGHVIARMPGFPVIASGSFAIWVGLIVVRSRRAIAQRYNEVDAEEALDLELSREEDVVIE